MPKPISNTHNYFDNCPLPPQTPSFGNNKISKIKNPSITGKLEHHSSLSPLTQIEEEEEEVTVFDLGT